MTIAIVTDTYLPQINGVVTAEVLLRQELRRLGHRVLVIAPSYGGCEAPEPDVYRYRSVAFPTRMTRENRFSFRVPCGEPLDWRAAGVEVIHSQVEAAMGSHARYWARRHGIAHVHTYHTLWKKYVHYAGVAAPLFARWVNWRTRSFCNRCDRIIAPSAMLKHELLRDGVTAPIDVIPTGIDAGSEWRRRPSVDLHARYGIPPHRRILLFVGRLAPEKGIDVLLHRLKDLVSGGADVHLVVVGDGPGRDGLETLVDELDLRACVTFTGYVPREAVFDYYRAADVFVFASLTETQGLVLLEAMSVGTPVVAVAAMGVADLMADGLGGLTVAPGDDEGFNRSVVRLLDDRALHARTSRDARAKAERWSIRATTARVVACYRAAIAHNRRGATG